MEKQLRVMVGDIGDETAASIAAAFCKAGDWAITRFQRHDKLIAAVRQEHTDLLILNLSVQTVYIPTLVDELQQLTDIVIIVVYRKYDAEMEQLLHKKGVHYVPYPERFPDLAVYARKQCGKYLTLYKTGEQNAPEIAVTHLLRAFGIQTNLRGFHYLRSAILIAYQLGLSSGCMMNMIYPAVAEEQQSTPSRVERSIRHAIAQAWENTDLRTYLNFGVRGDRRMTNSEFISFAVDWLRTEQAVKRYG